MNWNKSDVTTMSKDKIHDIICNLKTKLIEAQSLINAGMEWEDVKNSVWKFTDESYSPITLDAHGNVKIFKSWQSCNKTVTGCIRFMPPLSGKTNKSYDAVEFLCDVNEDGINTLVSIAHLYCNVSNCFNVQMRDMDARSKEYEDARSNFIRVVKTARLKFGMNITPSASVCWEGPVNLDGAVNEVNEAFNVEEEHLPEKSLNDVSTTRKIVTCYVDETGNGNYSLGDVVKMFDGEDMSKLANCIRQSGIGIGEKEMTKEQFCKIASLMNFDVEFKTLPKMTEEMEHFVQNTEPECDEVQEEELPNIAKCFNTNFFMSNDNETESGNANKQPAITLSLEPGFCMGGGYFEGAVKTNDNISPIESINERTFVIGIKNMSRDTIERWLKYHPETEYEFL